MHLSGLQTLISGPPAPLWPLAVVRLFTLRVTETGCLCCLLFARQASDTLTVSITLKPTPDMTHKLAKYLLPQQQVGRTLGGISVALVECSSNSGSRTMEHANYLQGE